MVTDKEITVKKVVYWTKLDFKIKKNLHISFNLKEEFGLTSIRCCMYSVFSCCQFLTMIVVIKAKSIHALKKIKWFKSLLLGNYDQSGLSCTYLAASTLFSWMECVNSNTHVRGSHAFLLYTLPKVEPEMWESGRKAGQECHSGSGLELGFLFIRCTSGWRSCLGWWSSRWRQHHKCFFI